MSERPTPRTDTETRQDEYDHVDSEFGPFAPSDFVSADFARQLERELAEARDEAEEQARLLGMSGEREAKLLAELAEAKEQRDEWQRAHDHVCKELATCEEHRDWNAGLWVDMKLERDRLAEELEKWKQNFIPFASVWAVQYGKDRYGENCLDSIHYDMLKEAGARMDDFKRAGAPESHNNVNVEARDQ